MKFLGVLLLAACALAAHHHGHHGHHAKHHYKHAMQSRSLNITDKFCEAACGSKGAQSFTIDLTATLNIKIVYNAAIRTLAFINLKLKIAFVFSSKAQIYAIVSEKGFIIVNAIIGIAKFVDSTVGAALFVAGEVDIYASVSKCGQVISENSKGVIGAVVDLIKDKYTFVLATLIQAVAAGDIAFTAAFALKAELKAKIVASFEVLIIFIKTTASAYIAVYGNLVIFLCLFPGTAIKVGTIYLSVTIIFFTSVTGFVDAVIIARVYAQIAIFIKVIISGVVQAITFGSNLAVQVYVQGSAAISLTTNGLVCVGDDIKGSIVESKQFFISVFGNASAELDFDVQVVFQAAAYVAIS